MTPSFLVLRVVNELPQVQVTGVSTYWGWMSASMALLRRVAGSAPARAPCTRTDVPVCPAAQRRNSLHDAACATLTQRSGRLPHAQPVGHDPVSFGPAQRDGALQHAPHQLDGLPRDRLEVELQGGQLRCDQA